MKNFKFVSRFFTLLLVVLICTSACTGAGSSSKTYVHVPEDRNNQVAGGKGIQDFTVTESVFDFIKDGVCNYVLVVPREASLYENQAIDEFNVLFEMATGLTLKKLNDSGLTHNAENLYISIGRTDLVSSANLEVDFEELGTDGARIITKDKTIFLLGGKQYGIVYSVYDFMADYFNFEMYSDEVMEIDKGVKNAKLLNFNITDTPDVELRAKSYEILDYSNIEALRMRQTSKRELLPIHETFDVKSPSSISDSHNSHFYLPRAIYSGEHPKWFSDIIPQDIKQSQLCYTAHGDEKELQRMIEECAKKIEFSLMTYTPEIYPAYNVVALNIMDNKNLCSCSSCMDNFRKYDNCNSASTIMFMNRLAKMVDEWMEKPENEAYRRDLKYIFFAYLDLERCPARYNEQAKKYEPIDENVRLYKNVGVYLALLDRIDYQVSIYHDENKQGREIIEAWADMTDYIWYWMYPSSYTNKMYIFDSFSFLSEGISFVADNNPSLVFFENLDGGFNWENLKHYLQSKLLWNSKLDVSKLVDKWFNANFGQASEVMKQVFYDMRAYYNDLIISNDLIKVRSCLNNNLAFAKYWNINVLSSWIQKIDEAKEIIKKVATDYDAYVQMMKNIERESVGPICIMLDVHFNTLSEQERLIYQTRLKDDIKFLKMDESDHTFSFIKEMIEKK